MYNSYELPSKTLRNEKHLESNTKIYNTNWSKWYDL